MDAAGRGVPGAQPRRNMSSLFARSKDFPRTRKSQAESPPASPSAAARTLRVSALFPGHSRAAGGGGSAAGGPGRGAWAPPQWRCRLCGFQLRQTRHRAA